MHWKEELLRLEHAKQWDEAIRFLQAHMEEHPSDVDAAIFMNYLLMNLLLEEQSYDMNPNEDKYAYYWFLAIKYFNESSENFSDNMEYVFCTSYIATLAPWYFGIDDKNDQYVREQSSLQNDPENPIYLLAHFCRIYHTSPCNKLLFAPYAQYIFDKNSSFSAFFSKKGAFGEYMISIYSWSSEECLGMKHDPERPHPPLNIKDFLMPDAAEKVSWKTKIKQYTLYHEWGNAIHLLTDLIAKKQDLKDAYIFLLYFLMNCLLNEQLTGETKTTYQTLLKSYANQSRITLGGDQEYCFYLTMIARMNPETVGWSEHDVADSALKDVWPAHKNLLYLWSYYSTLNLNNDMHHAIAVPYACIITEKYFFEPLLMQKGTCDEYIWQQMQVWADEVLAKPSIYPVDRNMVLSC